MIDLFWLQALLLVTAYKILISNGFISSGAIIKNGATFRTSYYWTPILFLNPSLDDKTVIKSYDSTIKDSKDDPLLNYRHKLELKDTFGYISKRCTNLVITSDQWHLKPQNSKAVNLEELEEDEIKERFKAEK